MKIPIQHNLFLSLILIMFCALFLLACTPEEKQKAASIQTEINAVTPVAVEGIDTGLTLTGNAPAATLNAAVIAPLVEKGQQAIVNSLNAQTNPVTVSPTPDNGSPTATQTPSATASKVPIAPQ